MDNRSSAEKCLVEGCNEKYYIKIKRLCIYHYKRKWAKENFEKMRNSNKKWAKNNPKKKAKMERRWVKANRKRVNECAGLRRKLHPERWTYAVAKSRTLKKGLSFELSLIDFSEIQRQSCSYCGVNHQRNTVDRIDSKKGYTKKNVQSLCLRCNKIKLDMSHLEFIEHLKKIYQYLKLGE